MKLKTLGLAVGMVLTMTSCKDTTNESANADFQVTAIDGYLKNAVVTVQCGSKTFTPAPTDGSGKTLVDTNGIPSSQCSVTISAASDGSTVDMATGKNFSTGELYLKTPVGLSGDLVATPFTTLVAVQLESGEASSLADAITQVSTQYGIPEELITADFVATKSSDAKKVELLSIALTPSLPKSESEYQNIIKEDGKAQRDDFDVKVGKVVAAAKDAIDQAINDGVDLNAVSFDVQVNSDGSVTIITVPNNPEDPEEPTGATGGSGSSDN